ncbi:MAG TPA: class I SAM-dependent methyltransferase [Anaerolineales bacterium]|nr:class I SAM-dependent methyltransferase [Anaerolineales bacterium]
MPLVMDPAEHEIITLLKAAQWDGRRVIEIGCGDGRLTLRIAALAPKLIEALDPDAARVRLARKNLPARYRKRVSYHVGHSNKLRYPGGVFDIAIFAWSL